MKAKFLKRRFYNTKFREVGDIVDMPLVYFKCYHNMGAVEMYTGPTEPPVPEMLKEETKPEEVKLEEETPLETLAAEAEELVKEEEGSEEDLFGKAEEEELKEEPAPKTQRELYMEETKDELLKRCEVLGLSKAGNKSQLADRLSGVE